MEEKRPNCSRCYDQGFIVGADGTPEGCPEPACVERFSGKLEIKKTPHEIREGLCQMCHREYTPWFCESWLWNLYHKNYHFLCSDCFMGECESMGMVFTGFKVIPENAEEGRIKQLYADKAELKAENQQLKERLENVTKVKDELYYKLEQLSEPPIAGTRKSESVLNQIKFLQSLIDKLADG